MSRSDADRLDDITAAITSIHSHLRHGPISEEIVMDAVAMRLLEIGEAVKGISVELTAKETDIPWNDIAGMRDVLAHHYFAMNPEIIQLTIDKRLAPLADAVERMKGLAQPEI
ncbi:MAG: HepT-like ribonuclease domain-containing protein [Dermatophilaceae bacterium]